MPEKRRHPRLDVNLPVILRCGGRLIPAAALNMSRGGMCIRAEGVGLTEAAQVEVIFDLSEIQRDISMRGRITRANPTQDTTELGVQFTNLSSPGLKAIEEYLNTGSMTI